MAIIEASQIKKTYFDSDTPTKVLRGVDFKIEKGEFVAIMGPSGSGKSTLLHILGFLDIPTSGTFKLDGKDSTSYSGPEIAKVRNKKLGFVFQSFNLLPRTNVYENVKLPLLYSNVPESKWDSIVRKAVESVGLTPRIYNQSSELSGGEKQRVAIARALVNEPEVIFADEPTGNLDSKSGQIIMEILEKLNKDFGHTIILITHETSTAMHAGRIIKIVDGMIESDEIVKDRKSAFDEFTK